MNGVTVIEQQTMPVDYELVQQMGKPGTPTHVAVIAPKETAGMTRRGFVALALIPWLVYEQLRKSNSAKA